MREFLFNLEECMGHHEKEALRYCLGASLTDLLSELLSELNYHQLCDLLQTVGREDLISGLTQNLHEACSYQHRNIPAYKKLLLHIGNDINHSELQHLLFLVRGWSKQTVNVQSIWDLWIFLEKSSSTIEDLLNFLEKCLKTINRRDLAAKVKSCMQQIKNS